MDGSDYYVYHIMPINLGLEAFANGNGIITTGRRAPEGQKLQSYVHSKL